MEKPQVSSRDSIVQYAAAYDKDRNGWTAYLPDLPGCIAAGDTRADVELLTREAIMLHIGETPRVRRADSPSRRLDEAVEAERNGRRELLAADLPDCDGARRRHARTRW